MSETKLLTAALDSIATASAVNRQSTLLGGSNSTRRIALSIIIAEILNAARNTTSIDEITTPGVWIPTDYSEGAFPGEKTIVLFVFKRYDTAFQLAVGLGTCAISIRRQNNGAWTAWKSIAFTT